MTGSLPCGDPGENKPSVALAYCRSQLTCTALGMRPSKSRTHIIAGVARLITVLCPAQEFFTHMEMSPMPVKAAGWKCRPMLSAQGLWAGRDLYRATPTVTRDLGFSCLIWRTAPISHLLRHAWGCGGPILTWILTEHKKIPHCSKAVPAMYRPKLCSSSLNDNGDFSIW
jgi:hypothetical protein